MNSKYFASKLIDHITGKAAFTAPALYIGLSSTLPTNAAGNVTEPAGGAYARKQISAAVFNSAIDGIATTSAEIRFAQATANWLAQAPLIYAPVFDAAVGGNMLFVATITSTPKSCDAGDVFVIDAGNLALSFV